MSAHWIDGWAIRLTDIALALLLIIFFSPAMIFMSARVPTTCGLPVFARDRAYTPAGHQIELLRFRLGSNPLALADRDGGHDLARLPWFINVLTGELSMVGPPPRPTPAGGNRQSRLRPGLVAIPSDARQLGYRTYWAHLIKGVTRALTT